MSSERAVHELRAQASRPLGARSAIALAVGLCICGLVVALAAGGVSSRVGAPPTGSLSALELAAFAIVGVCASLALVALLWARPWEGLERKPVPLRNRLVNALVLTAVLVIVALLVNVLPTHPFQGHPRQGIASPPGKAQPKHPSPAHGGPLDAGWAKGAAVAVGATLGIVALFLLYRNPRVGTRPESEEEPLDRAIAAGIEGLESESDPRRAVIKAYAGMEHALGGDGLVRKPSDTPLEFLSRALERLHASRAATVRLTALFEQAKFSDHVIDESMRGEALQALAGLRSELAQESV